MIDQRAALHKKASREPCTDAAVVQGLHLKLYMQVTSGMMLQLLAWHMPAQAAQLVSVG